MAIRSSVTRVHHNDAAGSARIDLDQLDFPGDSCEAKHLRITRLVERRNKRTSGL